MKKLSIFFFIIFMTNIFLFQTVGSAQEKKSSVTLPQLMADIANYEKKEISLVGTIVGACGSGCKMWISEGEYKDGAPVVLVWAKDKAFTFKTDATGQKVKLQGYAVGKYVDLCALEKKELAGEEKKTAAATDKSKKACPQPIKEKTTANQLKSITFFATSVDYLK